MCVYSYTYTHRQYKPSQAPRSRWSAAIHFLSDLQRLPGSARSLRLHVALDGTAIDSKVMIWLPLPGLCLYLAAAWSLWGRLPGICQQTAVFGCTPIQPHEVAKHFLSLSHFMNLDVRPGGKNWQLGTTNVGTWLRNPWFWISDRIGSLLRTLHNTRGFLVITVQKSGSTTSEQIRIPKAEGFMWLYATYIGWLGLRYHNFGACIYTPRGSK